MKPRGIVAVEGDNKLAFVQIVSKKVFYYTEDKHFLECKKKMELSDFKFNVATQITAEVFQVRKQGKLIAPTE